MSSHPLIQSAWVTLATPEFDRLVQFYEEFLGQSPDPYQPDRYAEFTLPQFRLGIFKPKASQVAEFANQTRTSLSLCLQVSDLQLAIDRLTQLGYPPSGGIITASHGQELYAADPVGNRLILYQPNVVDQGVF